MVACPWSRESVMPAARPMQVSRFPLMVAPIACLPAVPAPVRCQVNPPFPCIYHKRPTKSSLERVTWDSPPHECLVYRMGIKVLAASTLAAAHELEGWDLEQRLGEWRALMNSCARRRDAAPAAVMAADQWGGIS